jgi:hypothetical protein
MAVAQGFDVQREPVGKRITVRLALADDPGGALNGRPALYESWSPGGAGTGRGCIPVAVFAHQLRAHRWAACFRPGVRW